MESTDKSYIQICWSYLTRDFRIMTISSQCHTKIFEENDIMAQHAGACSSLVNLQFLFEVITHQVFKCTHKSVFCQIGNGLKASVYILFRCSIKLGKQNCLKRRAITVFIRWRLSLLQVLKCCQSFLKTSLPMSTSYIWNTWQHVRIGTKCNKSNCWTAAPIGQIPLHSKFSSATNIVKHFLIIGSY